MAVKHLGSGALAACLIVGVIALALSAPTLDARGEPSLAAQVPSWRVIDGDTLEDLGTGERIRLENIDTPETGGRAQCAAERQLGARATQQARSLISNAQRLDVRRTGRIDRYQRTIAFVEVDGRDFGELMIEEGLARPWRGRREPWCDASGNLVP